MAPSEDIVFSKNHKNKDLLIVKGKWTLTKDGKPNHDSTTRWKCTHREICTATVTLSADKTRIIRETSHKCLIDLLIDWWPEQNPNYRAFVCNQRRSLQKFKANSRNWKTCQPSFLSKTLKYLQINYLHLLRWKVLYNGHGIFFRIR